MKLPPLKIFVDFDGTITLNDVGDAMFERFGGSGAVEAVEAYVAGETSAVECFRRECAACGEVAVKELDEFLDRQEVDGTFAEFLNFCASENIKCAIFSDGMDYYINRILRRAGIPKIELYSNVLHFDPVEGSSSVRFRPEFPHQHENCDRCASCKRAVLVSNSAEEDIIVTVGEGYSDRCPAPYADIIFAKDDLAAWCRSSGFAFEEYQTFGDVKRRLQQMFEVHRNNPGKSRVHKRRQAELARRELIMQE
jgi:2,3-diketo-5-methylthio-1-phosphopentane phosphatase